MYRIIFVCGLLTHLINPVFGQINTAEKIDIILFEGLQKNKVTYVEAFLQCEEGTVLSDSLIQRDVQQLKNIASIVDARYRVDKDNGKTKLIFEIEERRTLLPIVKFGGIKGNVWFQLGGLDYNWQGKGEFLSVAYQNTDRRHSGNMFYRIPRIKQSSWGLSASLAAWASREPVYFSDGSTVNYDYNNNSIGLTGIRHFGLRKNLEFGATSFIEKYKKSDQQVLENPPGPVDVTHPKLLTKLIYTEDFLNYHFFYLEGVKWQLIVQDVYNFDFKTWFHSAQLIGNFYKRVNARSNLAVRLVFGVSTNIDTPFAPFVVDSHVNLRGVGNRIDRGTAQLVLNTEYRYTLKESKKWASQFVLFLDMGTWRNPGGSFQDFLDADVAKQFVGGGFRFIYQKIYGAVLRIDYGVDMFDPNRKGLVVGLGQYF